MATRALRSTALSALAGHRAAYALLRLSAPSVAPFRRWSHDAGAAPDGAPASVNQGKARRGPSANFLVRNVEVRLQECIGLERGVQSIGGSDASQQVLSSASPFLFQTLLRAGQEEQAQELLTSFLNSGGWMSANLAQSLLTTCARTRQPALAWRAYVEACALLPRQAPTPTLLAKLLLACVRSEHPPYLLPSVWARRALEAFDLASAEGVSLNRVHFHMLMDCQGKAGRVEAAFGVYRRMLAANLAPDAFTFTTLVSACARARAPRRAEQVMQELMPAAGVVPSTPVWNALLGAYARAGEMDRAYEAWMAMLDAGTLPDDFTERVLVEAFASNPAMASDLLSEVRGIRLEVLAKQRQLFGPHGMGGEGPEGAEGAEGERAQGEGKRVGCRNSSASASSAPTSSAPISSAPTSSAPTSSAPISSAPTSTAPISSAPTSTVPISSASTNNVSPDPEYARGTVSHLAVAARGVAEAVKTWGWPKAPPQQGLRSLLFPSQVEEAARQREAALRASSAVSDPGHPDFRQPVRRGGGSGPLPRSMDEASAELEMSWNQRQARMPVDHAWGLGSLARVGADSSWAKLAPAWEAHNRASRGDSARSPRRDFADMLPEVRDGGSEAEEGGFEEQAKGSFEASSENKALPRSSTPQLQRLLLLDLHGLSQPAATVTLLRRLELLVEAYPGLQASHAAAQKELGGGPNDASPGSPLSPAASRPVEAEARPAADDAAPVRRPDAAPLPPPGRPRLDVPALVVITGVGQHSRDQEGVLKEAMRTLMRSHALEALDVADNRGRLVVPWQNLSPFLEHHRAKLQRARLLGRMRVRYGLLLTAALSAAAGVSLVPRLAPWIAG